MHQIGDAKREETTASGADGAAGGDADEGRKVAEAEEEAALKLGLELGLTPAQIAFEQNKKRRVRSPPPRHRVALHTAQCTALDCRAPCMCVCVCGPAQCMHGSRTCGAVCSQFKSTVKKQVGSSYREKIDVSTARTPPPSRPHDDRRREFNVLGHVVACTSCRT